MSVPVSLKGSIIFYLILRKILGGCRKHKCKVLWSLPYSQYFNSLLKAKLSSIYKESNTNLKKGKSGAKDGIRTRDPWYHKPVL